MNDSDEEEDDEEEPCAKLHRHTYDTRHTHNTRSARRHSRVEENDDKDPISAALVNVNSKTASKLRAPDVKLIGSRRSTIKKLARITLEIMDEKNLFFASVLLNALAKITETLDTCERGADYSDYYKKHTLAELSTTLNRIHFKFLAQCRVNDARDVAEAIIVSYELLA